MAEIGGIGIFLFFLMSEQNIIKQENSHATRKHNARAATQSNSRTNYQQHSYTTTYNYILSCLVKNREQFPKDYPKLYLI